MAIRGYPIKQGRRLKVKFLKQGESKNGAWQMFTHSESKRNQETGQYERLATYTIFINNPIKNLSEGDSIIVQGITAVAATRNVYNGKEYYNIVVNCDAKLEEQAPNEDNFNLADTENPFDFGGGLDVDNLNISDDDLDIFG